MDFRVGKVVKNPSANAGDARDVGSIPGSGRSPGEGNVSGRKQLPCLSLDLACMLHCNAVLYANKTPRGNRWYIQCIHKDH